MTDFVSGYTALLQNLKTGRITAELPISQANASEILNGAGTLDVTMPLSTDDVALTAADIDERRNAVFLLRDNTIVGEGIIETQNADVKANSVQLSCLGWHNYLRNLFLKTTLGFPSEDQTLIAKTLVDYACSKSGALQFSTAGVMTTGRMRTRGYWWYDRQSIGELVDQLAAVIDGFNFRYRSTRGAEGFTTEFLTSYPATGRATNFVFELGGNVELLGLTGDGSAMANSVEAVGGAANQGYPPIMDAIDVDVLESTPLWEAVETYTDVSELGTLSEKARQRLARGRSPVRIPTLRIGTNVEPKIGQYLVGDRVRVRGHYGLLDVDADFIITQLDLTVSPTAEYVDIGVAPVEALL